MKKIYRWMMLWAVSCVAAVGHAMPLPGPVVTAEWLAKHRDQVQVVDVRSEAKSYTREPVITVDKKTGKSTVDEVGGVIPGALIMDYNLVRSERLLDGQKTKYLVPDKAELESRLRAIGLNSDKPIVLVAQGVDPGDVMEALRLYWTFKVYAEDHVAVLDGGMAGWLASGRAVDTGPLKKPTQGDWTAKGFRSALVADTAAVERASSHQSAMLLDGREASNFYGITKRAYVAQYGHIAGAKSLPPETLFRASQGALYFLSKAQYATLAQLAGLSRTTPTIAYCNSGHLASGAWFVMSEMVGNSNTSLYDGSLYLWSRDKKSLVGVLN